MPRGYGELRFTDHNKKLSEWLKIKLKGGM